MVSMDELFNAAKLYVRKETADSIVSIDKDEFLITVREDDIVAMIVNFVETHANMIKR